MDKEQFLKELEYLIKKYKITLDPYDNWGVDSDGHDQYRGTDFYLRFNGETDYSDNVNEIFKAIINKLNQ